MAFISIYNLGVLFLMKHHYTDAMELETELLLLLYLHNYSLFIYLSIYCEVTGHNIYNI